MRKKAMNGKKYINGVLCLLLALSLLLGIFPQSAYAELPEPTEPVEVELNVYSSVCNSGVIDGVYYDNVFYVDLDTLEKYTGIRNSYLGADGEVELTAFRLRHLSVWPDGRGEEKLGGTKVSFDCPYLEFEEKPYLSLLHLLRYLDIPVTFAADENEPVHLYITVPYTIYDAIAEYGNGYGTEFSWFEAGTTQEEVDKYLTRAGAMVLLNYYNISFRRAWTDRAGVEQEILEDAITRVIKEEGEDYQDRLDNAQTGLNTASAALDAEVDWIGYYTDVMKDLIEAGKKSGSTKAMDYLGNTATVVGGAAKGWTGMVGAITSISAYSEMTIQQRELLEKTVLSPQGAYVNKDYPAFYKACQNVVDKIAEANDGSVRNETLDAIIKVLDGTASDMLIEGFTGGGAVMLAIKAVPGTAAIFGDVEKDAYLLIALGALTMEDYALPIYLEKLNLIRKSDWFAGRNWKEHLTDLHYDMILSLKSSIAARHYAIRSGQYPLDEASMNATNGEAAVLLRKIEQAVILEPGKTDQYTGEDLHWIKELQLPKYGNSCNNINLGGIAAYSERMKTYVYRSDAEHKHKIGGLTFYTYELYAEDEKGNITILTTTANPAPRISIVRDWVYYLSSEESSYSGTIRRVKLDGTGDEEVMELPVQTFYIAFGRLFYTANQNSDSSVRLYRSKMDGSESLELARFASDDHVDGIWIYARDLLYYTKTSMSGGAVGFESGPTGLFKVTVLEDENDKDAKPKPEEVQLWDGDYRMASQSGTDLLFGDPFTDELYLFNTETETPTVIGKASYYQMNADREFHPFLNDGFEIRETAVDKNNMVYIKGGVTFGYGTNMNIAGDRVFYHQTTEDGKTVGIAWR